MIIILKLIKAQDVPFESVESYYQEFVNNNEKESNMVSFAYYGSDIYFEALESMKERFDVYFLVDDELPNSILGDSTIDFFPQEDMIEYGSISYEISPLKRRQGYGKKLLSLILKTLGEKGLDSLGIACLHENIASKKIIERNDAKFCYTFTDSISLKTAIHYEIPTIKLEKTYRKK